MTPWLASALLAASACALLRPTSPRALSRRQVRRHVLEDRSLQEPPEWELNRQKAKARKDKYSRKDRKGDGRRDLIDAQRLFRKKAAARPAYLPLRPEASLQNASAGQWFDGVVRSLKPHGAWVSIGSEVDGFVHCRDMSASEFVEDPGRVARVGDPVRCCVKGADAAKRVLSLSYLQVEAAEVTAKRLPVKAFSVDQKLENLEILRVTPHAAYVEVGASVPAYLHVADIGLLPRRKVGAAREPRLQLEAPGQIVAEAWVKAIDLARDRIRLTLLAPGDRDDWTLYGRRGGAAEGEDEEEDLDFGGWD